ncbi:Heterokaryon incompatibility protein (HET) domain containing protein [Hyaloscypha variabilis]
MTSPDRKLLSKIPHSPSAFSHNPLPNEPFAFRLLRILPASDTGLEIPDYRALSYVWGDPDITRNIYIEGKLLPVTKNCYAALACLRRKTTQVTLWIDAICIYQIDLKEKNQQLTIMVEIYAKAEEVLIWMGLNNAPILEDSNLEQLRYIEKLVVATIVDLTNSSDLKDHNARYKTILVEPPESNVIRIWGALVAIFSHEWWTRLWVHQELAVSKKATVVVGVHTFAWDMFLSLLEVLCTNKFEYSKADRLKSPKLEYVVIGYWHIINSNGFQSVYSRSMAPLMEQLRTVDDFGLSSKVTNPLDLKASIVTATNCHQFLRTGRGFVGLAPNLAGIGDEVWILLGCDVPMLLRKDEDHHILVGECFVYGMMEGEQTKSLLASGSLRTITLR